MSVAWQVSPKLAVMMAARLNHTILNEIMCQRVCADPLAVSSVPEAVRYLVTEKTVKANHPSLIHLLYWARVPPAEAVALLSRKYDSHPVVTQYALRVLRTFAPATVVFFIPQLVQSLRHDALGYIERFLVSWATDSYVICHQLIWNIRTYIARTEDGGYVFPDIGPILDRVSATILDNMDADNREHFDLEFDFFAKVTVISGILQPLRDNKDHQAAVLLDTLSKIEVPRNPVFPLYLPSNPESLVVKIDYTSGKAMPSAAKVTLCSLFGCVVYCLVFV